MELINAAKFTMVDVEIFQARYDALRRFQRDETYSVLSRFEKQRIIKILYTLQDWIRSIQGVIVFTSSTWFDGSDNVKHRLILSRNNVVSVERFQSGTEFQRIPSGWYFDQVKFMDTLCIDGGSKWNVSPPRGVWKEVAKVVDFYQRDAKFQSMKMGLNR